MGKPLEIPVEHIDVVFIASEKQKLVQAEQTYNNVKKNLIERGESPVLAEIIYGTEIAGLRARIEHLEAVKVEMEKS